MAWAFFAPDSGQTTLQANLDSIPHLKVRKPDLRIPKTEEKDLLAAEWKRQDENLADLIHAMR